MNLENPTKTEEALKWIVGILESERVPYAITGGFAAQIYGALRKLNDIDIDIPDAQIANIAEKVKPYLTYGPVRHKDDWWDLWLMTLDYKGQIIDISGGDTLKIFDPLKESWILSSTDFSAVEHKEVFGLHLPIISKQQLVKYKSILASGWKHQKNDVDEINNHL